MTTLTDVLTVIANHTDYTFRHEGEQMTRQEQDTRVIKIMEKAIKQIETCNEWHDSKALTSENAMKKIESILKEYNQDLNNLVEEITKSTKENKND